MKYVVPRVGEICGQNDVEMNTSERKMLVSIIYHLGVVSPGLAPERTGHKTGQKNRSACFSAGKKILRSMKKPAEHATNCFDTWSRYIAAR